MKSKNVTKDSEPEFIEIEAFGHRFRELRGNAEDLITLEKEGAIYSHFWDEASETFKYYRVRFLPQEIYQYVEAHIAKQEFDKALYNGASFQEALNAIQNKTVRQRVLSYGNYGKSLMRDGTVVDIRGCAASFYPPEMEDLVCGGRPDRYELLPNFNNIDQNSLIIHIIDNFRIIALQLAKRRKGKNPFDILDEYDVQDLLFACIRSIFDDARTEEWTPKHAGSAKRIDIVIPSLGVLIESKFIRNLKHAKTVVDEVKIDIESYHSHSSCKSLFVLIYDPKVLIVDPHTIEKDISGHRTKNSNEFDVMVMVRR